VGSAEQISAAGVQVHLGQALLSGDFSGSFAPRTRPSLKVRVESPHVRLADIGIEPDSELVASKREEREAKDGLGFVGEDPLPFEKLRELDLDLDLRVQRLTGREGFDVRNARLALQLADGDLRIRELSGVYSGGKVRGELRVDARRPEPQLMLKSDVEGMPVGAVMAQLQDGTDHAGWIDAAIDVRSSGDNLDAILSSLGGRVRIQLRDGTAVSPYARAFALDVFSAVVPRRRARRVEPVACAVGAFQLADGVAEVETLLVASDDIIVLGTGAVNLAGRSYDLLLTPKVRDPSLLSMAATVEVTGPLVDPVIRPRGRSLARSAARGLVGNLLRPDRVATRVFRDDTQAARAACGDAIIREALEP
jgi:uncharacterized protein involved in outer membrane biogenesis